MKYNDNGEWKDVQVKVANAIQNEYGESISDGYSQNYLNDKVVNVSNEVDEDYRVNVVMPSKFDTSQTPAAYYNATKSIIDNGIRITITTANTNLWCAFKLSNNLLGKQIYVSTTMTPSASNTGQIGIFYGTDAEPYKESAKITLKQSGNISGTLLSTLPANCTGVYALIYGNGSSSTSQVGNYVDYTNLIIGEGTPSIVVDNDEIYNKDNLEQYSTSEIRIGTWLGKPLYRKVIKTVMGTCTTNGTYGTSNRYTVDTNAEIKNFYGTIPLGGGVFPIFYVDSGGRFTKVASDDGKTLILSTNAVFFSGADCEIVVEYTKTTD